MVVYKWRNVLIVVNAWSPATKDNPPLVVVTEGGQARGVSLLGARLDKGFTEDGSGVRINPAEVFLHILVVVELV